MYSLGGRTLEKFKLPNLITYVGTASAVCGMIFSFNNKITYAMICLIVSGLSDLFDGKFARMFKRTKSEQLVGIELDSLSDVISFLLSPAIIFMGIGERLWYTYVICILFVISGITRLAVFNVNAVESNLDKIPKYYNGLPVTYSAIVFPLLWFTSKWLTVNQLEVLYGALLLILAYLYVSNIKIPKPRGKAFSVFAVVAIIAIIGLCLF